MRPTLIALTLTALSVIWGPATTAFAQDIKVAKGTITAIGGHSLTVKVGDHDMAFNVDSKTMVQSRGASSKANWLAVSGKRGPHLSDVLQPGQAVAVTYSDLAGGLRATEIKTMPKPRANADAPAEMRSTGVVKAIGVDSLTISGKGGSGSTFEQTFKVDSRTMVWARGASRAVAAQGGKAPFNSLVSAGDRVTVSYRQMGDSLIAGDVHVTLKATH